MTSRIHSANYKKHPSIITLFAEGDTGTSQSCRLGSECLLSIAYPHFFFILLPDLMSPQARPCPRGAWQAGRSCGTRGTWFLVADPRQRASEAAQPCANAMKLWCWRCFC